MRIHLKVKMRYLKAQLSDAVRCNEHQVTFLTSRPDINLDQDSDFFIKGKFNFFFIFVFCLYFGHIEEELQQMLAVEGKMQPDNMLHIYHVKKNVW